jgi:single-strand DNA-binding protein
VSKINNYEIMLIIGPETESERRTEILDRIKEIAAAGNGSIDNIDEWGKKRFAYEINHLRDGHYYVITLTATAEVLDEITRVLKITDEVIRFMPVALKEKVTSKSWEIKEKTMASINRVVLVGNLTRDPELRQTPNGTSVCDLGLAVNDRRKQGEEWVEKANFFDVTVWGAQAESCSRYLSKGRQVAIDGRLDLQTWESSTSCESCGAESTQKRSKIKVIAQNVQFLGSRQDAEAQTGAPVAAASSGLTPDTSDFESAESAPADDDIPF